MLVVPTSAYDALADDAGAHTVEAVAAWQANALASSMSSRWFWVHACIASWHGSLEKVLHDSKYLAKG